ncbi:uncharacterized protein LOC119514443 [Choloepus didactylus]|uniref:uncharacterized protein LOC119514443 n=1 Tax=Choloepus didactylus TaxID=27675 RepID=UPI00189DC68E|nr:uncharacterized protein LOC119514443 [Choloepus didactylus]
MTKQPPTIIKVHSPSPHGTPLALPQLPPPRARPRPPDAGPAHSRFKPQTRPLGSNFNSWVLGQGCPHLWRLQRPEEVAATRLSAGALGVVGSRGACRGLLSGLGWGRSPAERIPHPGEWAASGSSPACTDCGQRPCLPRGGGPEEVFVLKCSGSGWPPRPGASGAATAGAPGPAPAMAKRRGSLGSRLASLLARLGGRRERRGKETPEETGARDRPWGGQSCPDLVQGSPDVSLKVGEKPTGREGAEALGGAVLALRTQARKAGNWNSSPPSATGFAVWPWANHSLYLNLSFPI